jgi:DNA-binding LacI/PurR family transcriptional regulator
VAVLDAGTSAEIPSVRIDHTGAAVSATNYLLSLGHRRIAHIEGSIVSPMALRRREGFYQAINKVGLSPVEAVSITGDFTPEAGQSAMELLLERPLRPTAVFAANDEAAIGAILAAGLRVPEDISVIGFDNQRLGRIYNPALTTVHVPTFELGYLGMIKLMQVIQNDISSPTHQVLPTHIVERATTAAPASAHTS